MDWRYIKAVRPLAVGMSALVVVTGGALTSFASGNRDVQIGVIEEAPYSEDTILLDPASMSVEVDWTDQSITVGEVRLAESEPAVQNTVELGEVVQPISAAAASTTTAKAFSDSSITVTPSGSPTKGTNNIDTYAYTGATITPTAFTIKDGDVTLASGQDYDYDRSQSTLEAINPGTYTIVIVPTDSTKYTGTRTYQWAIAGNTSNSNASNTTSNTGTGGSNTTNTTTAGAPTINGLEENKSYCESVTFTVTGTSLQSVTANGATISAQSNGSYVINGTSNDQNTARVTVVATSTSGAATTRNIYVYQSHQYGNYASDNNGTLTKNATESATCSHGCGVKSTRTTNSGKVSTSYTVSTKSLNNETSGSGRYEFSYNIATNGLDVEVSGLNGTLAKGSTVTTATEQNAVNAGQTMALFLDVQQLTQITTGANSEFNRVDPNRSTNDRAYFEITLWKQLGSGAQEKVTDTGSNQVQITIGIPTAMRGASSYSILRYHNNQATVITPTSTTSTTVTFRTDKFSTYALTYGGTASGSSSTVSGNTVSGNTVSGTVQNSNSTSSTDTANTRRSSTGDSFFERMGMQLTILLVAGIGLAYCLSVMLRGRRD